MPTVQETLQAALRHHHAGDLGRAEHLYRAVLTVLPDQADALHLLGAIQCKTGRGSEGAELIRRALRLRPDLVDAYNNLATTLIGQDKLEEAIAALEQALRLRPDFASAHKNLGIALRRQGRPDAAIAALLRGLTFAPADSELHTHLGFAYYDRRLFDEAARSFHQALERNPDSPWAQVGLSNVWTARGDFAKASVAAEWRLRCPEWKWQEVPLPRWDGSELAGRTILLVAEQGLGDTLQFVRFAPLVKERGGIVVLQCQRALVSLLTRTPGIDRVIPLDASPPPCHVYAPLLSLPLLFQTTLDSIPQRIPYLFAEEARIRSWRQELSALSGIRIGISWHGNPDFRMNRVRSIPLAHFEKLAQAPGVQLISLQKNAGAEQLPALAERFSVLDLGPRLDATTGAVEDVAALLPSLDLIVACDTMLAHLGGGLGVPTWLALPFSADCRWLTDRDDSPWYPTVRLFRQRRLGDWAEVFQRMSESLRKLPVSKSEFRG